MQVGEQVIRIAEWGRFSGPFEVARIRLDGSLLETRLCGCDSQYVFDQPRRRAARLAMIKPMPITGLAMLTMCLMNIHLAFYWKLIDPFSQLQFVSDNCVCRCWRRINSDSERDMEMTTYVISGL